MALRYLSVCSGIEAATVAWHPLGFQPVAFSEVDKFPSAVLAHHYPTVPNWGDMTKFKDWPNANIDLLVGGTPCQSFSVAGLRAGLADPRGSLLLTYLAIADRYRPRWLVWENVPGVLSADGGRAFGALLGGLAELGYGFAHRVLDAQYFGLAQRRQRVFVVGHLGDWRRAAAVLFERESLSGHPAPRREAGESVAGCLTPGAHPGGYNGQDAHNDMLVADTLRANSGSGGRYDKHPMTVTHSLRADGFDASEDGTGRGTPIVPIGYSIAPGNCQTAEGQEDIFVRPVDVGRTLDCTGADPSRKQGGTAVLAFTAKDHGADCGDIAPTLRAGGFTGSHANGGVMPAVAFQPGNLRRGAGADPSTQTFPTLNARGTAGISDQQPHVATAMQVRRLTPRECERLQGFPDDYTLIPYRGKPAADGPRYKALGNSMAVPVMAWIGRRLQLVEGI